MPKVEVLDRRRRAGDDDAWNGPLDSLGEVLAGVLAAEGVGGSAEADLHFVDIEEISVLNAEHLGVEGPTDVLSFPIDGVGDGPDWMVGDVVVCPAVAVAQAEHHAGTVDDELRLLVVHAGLHLCGWDHRDPAEQDAMWARERALMQRFGGPPAADPWALTRGGPQGEPDEVPR